MSIESRLDKLEGRLRSPYRQDPVRAAVLKEYLNACARARGEPEEPWTEEELAALHEADVWFLKEGIPAYRHKRGWQSPEAQEILDGWERDTRQKIEAYDRKAGTND